MLNYCIALSICGILLWKTVGAQVNIPAVIPPINGDIVNVTCNIATFTSPAAWTNDDNSATLSTCFNSSPCSPENDGKRYSFSATSSFIIITISNYSSTNDILTLKCEHAGNFATYRIRPAIPVTTVQLENRLGQTLISPVNVARDKNMEFRCSTGKNGSRPRATFKWYKKQENQLPSMIMDQSISSKPDPIPVPVHNESDLLISYSTLTLKGDTVYQNLYIFCEARDETNRGNYVRSGEIQLNIVYPPVVQLSPSTSPYNVTEGTQTFVFTCNVTEANPMPQANSYSWFHKTSVIKGQTLSSYTLLNVHKSDDGEYKCTARNDYGNGTSNSLDLDVQYGPVISHLGGIDVEEGGIFNVTCNVSANPPSSVFWTRSGEMMSNSSLLRIPSISRLEGGDYICTSINILHPTGQLPIHLSALDTLTVNVLYGPGNSTSIDSNVLVYKIEEGKSAHNINCSAVCNPRCSYRWLRNYTQISSAGTLSLGVVSRNFTGRYDCEAFNTVMGGKRSSTISIGVNVIYGAEIINLSVLEGNIVNKNNTVNENNNASLKCQVDSDPESNITWTNQGTGVTLKADFSVHESQLTIEHANCLDTSNYTCRASNGLSTLVEGHIPFYVTCHPRTDFRSPPLTKVYGKRYGNANLTYTVISFPESSFNWTFIGNGSENRLLPDSASYDDNGLQSVLKFRNLSMNDFGFYQVIARNSFFPSAIEVFQLIQADVPDVPSNVTITDVRQTSLTVQWVSGYNGGFEQTFHIMITAGDDGRSMYVLDPGFGKVGTQTIEDLLPNTEYSIYMSANNSVGSSKETDLILQITLKVRSKDTGLPIHAVAGGVAAGMVAILLVGLGIIVWRRYQRTKDSLEGLVDNPVYDSSDVRPGSSSEIALVDKSKTKASQEEDPIKLYAQVPDTNKSGQKRVKGKPGKHSKGQIYENAAIVERSKSNDNVHANSKKSQAEDVYENPGASASDGTMGKKDGLLYVDLILDPPTTKNGKPVILGIENRTEYAEIAYGKRGEPLPDIDGEMEKTS